MKLALRTYDMRRLLPTILYLIAAILVYPLIITIGNFARLLGGKGARTYLLLYCSLPVLIIAAIVFLIYVAVEIKHHNDIGE